jgi:hypothetical protein
VPKVPGPPALLVPDCLRKGSGMRQVDAHTWALMKQHSTSHLTDPDWLGGGHCITHAEVHGRVHLPVGPWDAVLLSRTLHSSGPADR